MRPGKHVLESVATHVWEGGVEMKPIWDLSRLEDALCIDGLPTRSDVSMALDALRNRIDDELAEYEAMVKQHGDIARKEYVDWARQWITEEGLAIIAQLRAAIWSAGIGDLDEMRRTIEASVRLADLAKQRDLSNMAHWDLVWEWALDILPSVHRAFERFVTPMGTDWQLGLSSGISFFGNEAPIWDVGSSSWEYSELEIAA